MTETVEWLWKNTPTPLSWASAFQRLLKQSKLVWVYLAIVIGFIGFLPRFSGVDILLGSLLVVLGGFHFSQQIQESIALQSKPWGISDRGLHFNDQCVEWQDLESFEILDGHQIKFQWKKHILLLGQDRTFKEEVSMTVDDGEESQLVDILRRKIKTG